MRRLGKWTVSVILVILIMAWAPTVFAGDDGNDIERKGEARSESGQTVTAQRGPPEPVPVFSRRTVAYQLVAGPSAMAGVGVVGGALLGVGVAAGGGAGEVFAWPGVVMVTLAPPIGAMIGSTWVGLRRYERGGGNLTWTAKGTMLGWMAGMYGLDLLTDESADIDGDFVATYFATSAAGSLIGSIIGYHLGQKRENYKDATDIRRWSTIDVAPLGVDGGTDGVGVMLRASGRF